MSNEEEMMKQLKADFYFRGTMDEMWAQLETVPIKPDEQVICLIYREEKYNELA